MTNPRRFRRRLSLAVAALLAAGAAVLDENRPITTPFAHAWYAELNALPLRPDEIPGERRAELADAMTEASAIVEQPGVLQHFISAEVLAADRAALATTGDFGAALRALAPPGTSAAERAAALLGTPELRALVDLVSH